MADAKPLPPSRRPAVPAASTASAVDAGAEAVPTDIDRALHAALAHVTRGLSPGSLLSAFGDWAVHLAASPGKQLALAVKARRKALRLLANALRTDPQAPATCIEPLPQDRRFTAPEWQRWPFNLVYQAFLLQQQWWHNATTGVEGVTRHHEQLVTFFARQWLDMFSPSNFLLTNPEAQAETLRTGGANLVRGFANRIHDALRLADKGALLPDHPLKPGADVALTPGKVVWRNHLIELIEYAPQTATVHAHPVLIVPSWIMKYYILDLTPQDSLVRFLVERGHPVYMVSWKNPGAEDRELGMDDYLDDGVMAAIAAVSQRWPRHGIQGVGYCLGGTLLAIAAAAMAQAGDRRLRSLSLLASEVDFTEPGELGLFIDESQLAFLDDLMSEQGYLDGRQMAGAFAMLNSRDMVWSRMERAYLLGRDTPLTPMASWNADATRMPRRQHREYLERLYLRNDLAEGRYRVGGKAIALSDIRVPVFALGTERDTVAPWRSVHKIHLLCRAEVTFCLTSGGHNAGVVNPPATAAGHSYRIATRGDGAGYLGPAEWEASTPASEGSWWPAWADWLGRHGGKRVAARPAEDQGVDAPGLYVLEP
jgi:polyhydroxyalkanoate synthase